MEKTNLIAEDRRYYKARTKPELVTIEKAQYISIRGTGDPNKQPFADKVQALYTTAYTLKFMFKALELDFVVPKLEALWWFDIEKYQGLGFTEAPLKVPRDEWQYRLLIRIPSFITPKEVKQAILSVVSEKQLKLAHEIEWYKMMGGRFVQMLHVGPFDKEPESLLRIEAFMQEKGLKKNRLHHEIYLSDFRLTPPEKFKTILREPVK